MYVTFRNNSTGSNMIVSVERQRYIINPKSTVEIFCGSPKFEFVSEISPFDELTNAANELETESHKLRDRVFSKLAKKFAEKVTEIGLNTAIRYEADFESCQRKNRLFFIFVNLTLHKHFLQM